MALSYFWGGHTHRCLLIFTSTLLVYEIVVGRFCNSLINMVDGFHTLYVLIRIILRPWKIFTGTSGTSIANSYPSSNLDPHGPLTDAPAKPVDSNQGASPINTDQSVSSVDPEDGGYSMLRVQPFGALISALLLASLCVSITLEILSHLVQPHSVQHPIILTVTGAISLLFNAGMLLWRGYGWMKRSSYDEVREDQKMSNDSAKTGDLEEGAITDTEVTGHRSPDGTLIFCNLGASIVPHEQELGLEQRGSSSLSSPDLLTSPSTDPHQQSNHVQNPVSYDSTNLHQPQQEVQLTDQLNVEANYSACTDQSADICNHMTSKLGNHSSCLEVITTVTQSLLTPVLVVLNGLVLLVQGPDCLQHHWTCHLFMYLDPGFSMLAVVVLLAVTLPELRRHGLVLLQATPAWLCPQELASHIRQVPGVLAVHELHVWQLSEEHLVASVHVHCPSGLKGLESSELLEAIAKVLTAFGITHSTVQPEFLDVCGSNNAESVAFKRQEKEAGLVVATTTQMGCVLSCGKECLKKMCCSPPEENSSATAPSAGEVEILHQEVIENTHL